MPGQRRRREREARRARDRKSRQARGRWEVLFETTDEAEWLAYHRRRRKGSALCSEEDLRIDVLCGRGAYPTTYRLSVLVSGDLDRDACLRSLRP
ncbi:hypothetical protein [Nocardiopsis deserti]|uniref:hypothetical protein n=1 Tax=Nocardiopsis deserti TaxID=2605988 RepID=UPI001238640A|nr:hypothetical protein [Nocardiopsis deserti]